MPNKIASLFIVSYNSGMKQVFLVFSIHVTHIIKCMISNHIVILDR